MSKENHNALMKAAEGHMLERFAGGTKKSSVNKTQRWKDVNCIMCHRPMTAPKFENPPFYCYKCDCEAEGVFGSG